MALTLASDAITFTDSTSLSSGIIGTEQLAVGAVTTQKIANNAITTNQIGFSGCVLQTVQVVNNAFQSITNGIPQDNTIPESTEGTPVLTATITPTSFTNKILIKYHIYGSADGYMGSALFRQGETFCIAAVYEYGVSFDHQMHLEYLDSPNTTSPITYVVHVGPVPSGTYYLHQNYQGTPYFGGAQKSNITLMEIKG